MADIQKWKLVQEPARPAPIIHGFIAVEGDFTWLEWIAIREALFRARSSPLQRFERADGLDRKGIVDAVMSGANPAALAEVPLVPAPYASLPSSAMHETEVKSMEPKRAGANCNQCGAPITLTYEVLQFLLLNNAEFCHFVEQFAADAIDAYNKGRQE